MLECLQNIVGITSGSCPCLTGNMDAQEIEALETSKSGLFTDDLEGGIQLRALDGIDACKSFAQMAITARDGAIKRVSDDIILALSQRYTKNKDVFHGEIGGRVVSSPYQMTKRWGGQRIKTFDLSDGVIKISAIELAFTASTSVNVHIVRALCGAETGTTIASYAVPTSQSGFAKLTLPEPFELVLRSGTQHFEYYIVYDKSLYNGALPMNNKCYCNCGTQERILRGYVNVEGVGFDNISTLQNKYVDSFAHGLILHADIRCNAQYFICREYDANEPVSITLAYAAWYKTGELIIEAIMRSNEVNRYTMVSREFLWGKRNHFKAEYESRIKWLASEGVIDINDTDCFICKNDQLFYTGILS